MELFLYFSMTSSFWVFFSSVCFFSSFFALCFSKSNCISFSLYTVCLWIPDWSVRSFMLFGRFVKTWCFACHVFRAWLITAFTLPFSRFYACRWTPGPCFLLVKATLNMYRPECVCYRPYMGQLLSQLCCIPAEHKSVFDWRGFTSNKIRITKCIESMKAKKGNRTTK